MVDCKYHFLEKKKSNTRCLILSQMGLYLFLFFIWYSTKYLRAMFKCWKKHKLDIFFIGFLSANKKITLVPIEEDSRPMKKFSLLVCLIVV